MTGLYKQRIKKCGATPPRWIGQSLAKCHFSPHLKQRNYRCSAFAASIAYETGVFVALASHSAIFFSLLCSFLASEVFLAFVTFFCNALFFSGKGLLVPVKSKSSWALSVFLLTGQYLSSRLSVATQDVLWVSFLKLHCNISVQIIYEIVSR